MKKQKHINSQKHLNKILSPIFTSLRNNSNDKNYMHYHFASNIQTIYSPFQKSYYLPPHLSSTQITNSVFKSESNLRRGCKAIKKKCLYDNEYAKQQQKIKNTKGIKWNVESKIKPLIDEDKQINKGFKPHQLVYDMDQQNDSGQVPRQQ